MKITTVNTRDERRYFLRFLIVGASGTLIDFGLLTLLKSMGVMTVLANSVSFSAGIVNNFIWNRNWTFNRNARTDWQKQFIQFASVSFVGLMLNNGIVLALEGWLEELHGLFVPGYLTAKLIATCVVVAWNYLANRHWTFGPAITTSHKLSSSLHRLIRPQS